MNTPSLSVNKNLVVLAQVLQRLEQSDKPVDAEQYRSVVVHVTRELQGSRHDAALDAVLEAFPTLAELYENIQYQHAGLCRTALEPALRAEMAARAAILQASRRAAA